MSKANTQTYHLTDEGHRLALDQIHQVLRSDLDAFQRHAQAAATAKRVAESKYTQSLQRLAKAAHPGAEIPDGALVQGDAETNTITVTLPEQPKAEKAPKALRGGKVT